MHTFKFVAEHWEHFVPLQAKHCWLLKIYWAGQIEQENVAEQLVEGWQFCTAVELKIYPATQVKQLDGLVVEHVAQGNKQFGAQVKVEVK